MTATPWSLLNADAFHSRHPNWPGVSEGEWPLTGAQRARDASAAEAARSGCTSPQPETPAGRLQAVRDRCAQDGIKIVTGPLDDEDRYLIREEAWDL